MFIDENFFAIILLVAAVSDIMFCMLQNTKVSSLKVMLLGLAVMIFAGNVLKDGDRTDISIMITALGLSVVIAGLMIRGK
jgi:hypothetical protein